MFLALWKEGAKRDGTDRSQSAQLNYQVVEQTHRAIADDNGDKNKDGAEEEAESEKDEDDAGRDDNDSDGGGGSGSDDTDEKDNDEDDDKKEVREEEEDHCDVDRPTKFHRTDHSKGSC